MNKSMSEYELTKTQQAALNIIKIVDYDRAKCADPNFNLDGEDPEYLLEKLDDFYNRFAQEIETIRKGKGKS